MKRTLCLIFSLLTLCAVLVACGETAEVPASDASPVSDTTPVSEGAPTSADATSTPDGTAVTPPTTPETVPETTPPTGPIKFVIPEGYTFYQIARKLEQTGVCKAKAFFDAAQNYSVQSFPVPSNANAAYRYEGYLWPATYEFLPNDDPEEVLRDMLNAYAAYSGLPDLETLTLASVIEKESRSDAQRAMISAVFHNRMDIKMQLGSDVTREYANDNIVHEGTWIKNADRFRVLYNTTRSDFKGSLPAGPICSPGAAALAAAKNPAKTDALFFFYGADYENHYAKTYAEHLKLIEQYGVWTADE
jgi:UPF0755 protein